MPNAPIRIAERPANGVNLVGPLDAGSGLGEAARMLRRAIEHAGIPFAAITFPESTGPSEERSAGPRPDVASYDVNVLCLQPDQLMAFAPRAGRHFFAGRPTIGLWFWESTVFSERFRPATRLLDRVWVTSEHVRSVLAPATTADVRVIPVPLRDRRVDPVSRDALGLPDGFLFLALLDLISARRKNARAVVEAFRRAFEPGSGATLVVKTINGGERKPRALAELRAAARGRGDIRVVDGFVSEQERDALIAACDCFVSLHRAEGLGLPLLEAMSLGKPVIATGFSGNLEFMDDESSYLVPYQLVPVPEGEWGSSASARWAEPSVEAAAALMRRVFDAPEQARAIGEAGRRKVRARFSVERAAAALAWEVEDARRHPRLAERALRRRSIVEASLSLARDPMLGGAASRRDPVSLARRVLLRALWPQLAEQRERDDALLQALTDVERAVARLEAQVATSSEGRASEALARRLDQVSAKRVAGSSSSGEPENV